MSRSANDKKTPADKGAASVVVTFHPFVDNTQAVVTLVRGVAPRADRLRVWSGYLDVTRADLRGVGAALATRLLCDALARVLPGVDGEPIAHPADSAAAGGPGAPLGATGGTVTQLEGQLMLEFV